MAAHSGRGQSTSVPGVIEGDLQHRAGVIALVEHAAAVEVPFAGIDQQGRLHLDGEVKSPKVHHAAVHRIPQHLLDNA